MADKHEEHDSLGNRRPKYWRSLNEIEQKPEFQEFLHREFPQAASEFPEGVSRRRWLQLMGASLSLAGVAGCRWAEEDFVPFSARAANRIPGEPQMFATFLQLRGLAQGLLVTNVDGRPIKVDGNPQHPEWAKHAGHSKSPNKTYGPSDSFAQASVLNLYDPDRVSEPVAKMGDKRVSKTTDDIKSLLKQLAGKHGSDSGAGLRILAGATSSIVVKNLREQLSEKFGESKWVEYEPVSSANMLAGTEKAFGEVLRPHYNLKNADIILSLDADLLGADAEQLTNTRDWAAKRTPENVSKMNRMYVAESLFTQTGAAADHRYRTASKDIPALLLEIEKEVDLVLAGEESAAEIPFVKALVDDLNSNKGHSVIIAGQRQSAEVHARVCRLNSLLGNIASTVEYTEDAAGGLTDATAGIVELVEELNGGKVKTLVVLGGNPVYDAPVDLKFSEALAKAETSIHLSEYEDETSLLCSWHIPATHAFEQWDAGRSCDGTITVSQPLISPLHNGVSQHGFLAALLGIGKDDQTLVREELLSAMSLSNGRAEAAWEKAVHDGFVASTAFKKKSPSLSFEWDPKSATAESPDGWEVVFVESECVFDGRFANNGWLQETPDFITKLTWDNAALLSPKTADELGTTTGDMIEVTVDGRSLKLPVFIAPGQAYQSISVALGYGRTAAGVVGGNTALDTPTKTDPVGFNAYSIRPSSAMGIATDVSVKKVSGSYSLSTTQDHFPIDEMGLQMIANRLGQIVREGSEESFREHPDFAQHVTHHPPLESLWTTPLPSGEPNRKDDGYEGYAWGMSVDLSKCVGCNACMVACQSENNVPIVGKEQVGRNREMHWLRMDRYFIADPDVPGSLEDPAVTSQPMACVHCENAPCEQVCPVAATVHDDEGLNTMVYNRCIGTRYCANNCPYKVRRFNYFYYNSQYDHLDYDGQLSNLTGGKTKEQKASAALASMVLNPEVTVRTRGVMEKCTYCTQRIQKAKITANNENRNVEDGEIVTACQAACPSDAIVFGDINNPDTAVSHERNENPRSYALLSELNVRPRTTYLARIRNPHPDLEKSEPYYDLTPIGHGHGGEHGEAHDSHDAEHGGDAHKDEHHHEEEHHHESSESGSAT
ncbi:TAT-variant-translocated molybdopterin oxidoreductase [Calycomorphotria hydatis]|uniref:Tetrathionate reductase subunit B n=1 Tax=Calycomorphotria hydatis TaxID=2528027 RepID=A0A517T8X2_9PLAN|nr:TAT-variant-translocated molybdopterin oxidoreductase [Calycomorphotria hydatis]QDT64831.1 Tetrathionate reductase subunit B precursor [Calycomorphotria hydatis]